MLLVASSFNYVQRRERLAPSESFRAEDIDGVQFAWLRTVPYQGNSISKLRNMLSFARRLRKRAIHLPGGKPDLIIGSSPHPFAADEARKLAKSLGVPFIVEIRDLWPRTLVDVGGISPWHPLVLWMRRIERRLYRDAARILTLLPSSAPYFEAYGVEPRSIEWVPNALTWTCFHPRRPLPRTASSG